MNDFHGTRPRPALEQIQANLPQKIRFKIWTVNEEACGTNNSSDGCPLDSASRKQKARAASGTSEAMGLQVPTELLLDSAAGGVCRREGVGTIRHLSTKVLWLLQWAERRVVVSGSRTSAKNRSDLGMKSSPVHRPETGEAVERSCVGPK